MSWGQFGFFQWQVEVNTLAAANGIVLPEEPLLVHFADRQDVVAWYLERAE